MSEFKENKIQKDESQQVNKQLQPDSKPPKKHSRKKKRSYLWLMFVLFLAFIIAFGISLASDSFFKSESIVICVVIIVILIALAFLGDVFAVAVAYAELDYFNAMASKKIKGAKICIRLIQNSDKVSSLLADILGDVCAIVSGSVGASLTSVIISGSSLKKFEQTLIVALVGAAISGVTVFAKAIGKKIAIKNSTKIVFAFGKFLSLFNKK